MRNLSAALTVAALGFTTLTACGTPAPAPDAAAPADEKPSCSLSWETLPGRSFVRQTKGDGDRWENDEMARLQFVSQGDALQARYSVRSLTSVYDYSCSAPGEGAKEGEFVCMQDNPDLNEYCRSLHFNVGSCTATQMATVLGLPGPTPEIEAAVAKLAADLKKLKPAELEKMKLGYNSPNTQLRGILKIKFKTKDECRLSVSDLYENFSNGGRYEQENLVGKGARFAETQDPLVFEDCRDLQNLVASADASAKLRPGESQQTWAKGDTAYLRYAGNEHAKAEPGCTYSMDTGFGYRLVGQGVPVETGADGRLNWSFQRGVTENGRTVAHLTRYKACSGGTPQKVDTTCQVLTVR
jgi:hypothetical protein